MVYNLDCNDVLSADELICLFNSTCTSTLDSVAPLRTKRTKALSEPWLNDSTRGLRRACRQAERRWKKDKLRVSHEILKSRLSDYQKAIKSAKTRYISNLVSNNYHRPQVLFNIFNNIINPGNRIPILPTPVLCDSFLKYFVEKISLLRSSLIMSTDHQHPIPPMLTAIFGQFEPISISFLSEVVHHLRPTNCPSDSIPARF